MKPVKRALSTLAVTTTVLLVGAGLNPGAAVADSAPARTAPAAGSQKGLLDLLSVLQLPVLSGLPQVGSLLSISSPVWNLPGVSTAYTWLKDGKLIPGATGSTYVPSTADLGHLITGEATGSLLGLLPLSVLTSSLSILDPGAGGGGGTTGDLTGTLPQITGTPQVGELLSASNPVWSLVDVLTKFQWLSDGVAIPGATDTTYSLQPSDLGHQITVKVTGVLGELISLVTSSPVTALLGAAPVFSTQPAISGLLHVGGRLTAVPGATKPSVTTFDFQWLRGGVPIAGATQSTYVTKAADAAKQLSVQVTTKLAGHGLAHAVSPAKAIDKLASATKLSTKRTVVQGKAAVMQVQVSTKGGAPTGLVAVLDGLKVVKTQKLPGGSASTRLVRILVKGLKVGKHQLRAVYVGNASTAPSLTPITLVKVKHKHRH